MSSSGVWGPTPPGVNLAENQNASIIASVAVVMVIGLSAIVLRMFARLSRNGPGLAIDDYVILVAAVFAIGNAFCCLVSIQWGGGKHLWVVTVDGFTNLYKTTFAFVIVYINSVTLTKTSIMLYYRRLFGTSIIWWIVFALTIGHGAEVTITWLAGCQPLNFYWKQYTDPTAKGHCINASVFYFVNGIIGMVVDISILLVPIPTVIKLQMPRGQKAFVIGILCLGGFVCLASIIRIIMMDKLVKAHDFTWAMCQVFIWSCVEPFIGILCACLPTFAPLVRRWNMQRKTQAASQPKVSAFSNSKSSNNEWERIYDPAGTLLPDKSEMNDIELGQHPMPNKSRGVSVAQNEIMVTKNVSMYRTS